MSHLGLKILYHLLNSREWLAAERAFSPWPDLEDALRRTDAPLTTSESGRSLKDFDLVGFSLQHELSYTNILNALDLCGIPFMAEERGGHVSPLSSAADRHVLIRNRLPLSSMPWSLAMGEATSLEICHNPSQSENRSPALESMIFWTGFPVFKGFTSLLIFWYVMIRMAALRKLFRNVMTINGLIRPCLSRLDIYPYPERQIVSFTELVHDRVAVEISRGCTRGCRFLPGRNDL